MVGIKQEFRQSQNLVMTQALQQSIKLLQLSAVELQEYIDEELEKNPLLTKEETESDEHPNEVSADEPTVDAVKPRKSAFRIRIIQRMKNWSMARTEMNGARAKSAPSQQVCKAVAAAMRIARATVSNPPVRGSKRFVNTCSSKFVWISPNLRSG